MLGRELKRLGTQAAIYGLGGIISRLVAVFLLPVYTVYLGLPTRRIDGDCSAPDRRHRWVGVEELDLTREALSAFDAREVKKSPA